MAQVDTLPQLMERLDHIRRLIDHDQDLRESQWYEPWDLVLNWLRIRTDLRLTIAPQFMISRQYYAGNANEDYSITADTSTSSDSELIQVKDQYWVPDFSVFFASGDYPTRSLPIIVEIKPYHYVLGDEPDSIYISMELTRRRLQEQVCFAFDRYTLMDDIYVLCVIGWHWDLLKFERRSNQLPSGKYVGDIRSKGKGKGKGKGKKDDVGAVYEHDFKPRHMLNSQRDDFSDDFKAGWNMAMGSIGCITNF